MLIVTLFAIIGIILLAVGIADVGRKRLIAGLVLIFIAISFAVIGGEYGRNHIPEGYIKLDSYYYIDETGEIREIEGPFYLNQKNDTYYTQRLGASLWIPFGTPGYEPVDLPESNTTQNDSTTTTQCPSCGYSCTTAYCGNCHSPAGEVSEPNQAQPGSWGGDGTKIHQE